MNSHFQCLLNRLLNRLFFHSCQLIRNFWPKKLTKTLNHQFNEPFNACDISLDNNLNVRQISFVGISFWWKLSRFKSYVHCRSIWKWILKSMLTMRMIYAADDGRHRHIQIIHIYWQSNIVILWLVCQTKIFIIHCLRLSFCWFDWFFIWLR